MKWSLSMCDGVVLAVLQFLLLKLNHMSIVKYITFGKFEQSHVCNMKHFQVYCGLKEDHLSLVLEE